MAYTLNPLRFSGLAVFGGLRSAFAFRLQRLEFGSASRVHGVGLRGFGARVSGPCVCVWQVWFLQFRSVLFVGTLSLKRGKEIKNKGEGWGVKDGG